MILKSILKIKDVLKNQNKIPYGVKFSNYGFCSDFAGCGVETLTSILIFCGFEFENIKDKENYFIAFKGV